MASIRRFKKELTYLVNQVISDCYVALYFQPDTKREAIIDVVSQAVELNNDLLDRINHPQQRDEAKTKTKTETTTQSKPLKTYYTALRAAMFEGIDKAFDRLGQVCGDDDKDGRDNGDNRTE